MPTQRPLTVYALDPSHGKSLGNYMTMRVPYEKLRPGPQGDYVSVIDYDFSNRRYYTPVDLDSPDVLLQGGLRPSESDPRFHQQMVYAVSRETMDQFERALGRRLKWGYRRREPLRIFPHALQEPNAFYDRNSGALIFGYFAAAADNAGANLPNQTVFTCLSHDIIAHETVHALLDGQRRYFLHDTNPDVAAFHEGFADIVAIFQHFTYEDVLLDTMMRTGGKIFHAQVEPRLPISGDGQARIIAQLPRDNPLIGLAQQFGEALGQRAALRNALMYPPNSRALETTFEPHDRGGILVAAVFDAFFSSFERRTADLFRIARAGAGGVMSNDLHPDLAARLSAEAAKIAQHFVTMCIRAIDYCPPVDLTFGDYLRALVTADHVLYPSDPYGYRAALIESFRLRGIHPDSVISMAEESLLWDGADAGSGEVPVCEGLKFDVVNGNTRETDKRNYQLLHAFGQRNMQALYLVPDADKLSVDSANAVIRVNEGVPQTEIVVELMQRKDVRLDPADRKSPTVRVYGGSTVHLNANGTVKYVIRRRLAAKEGDQRLERMRAHLERKRDLTYVDRSDVRNTVDTRLDFSLVHRGI